MIKALENSFRFFEPRGICNSSSYVGSSGSSSGASTSGSSGGDSALTQSILGSVSQAGESSVLGFVNSALKTPGPSAPVTNANGVSSLSGGSSWMTYLIVGVVILLGFFAWREL